MRLDRRRFLGVSAAALALPALARAAAPIRVVATTGMIADLARRVGGDTVEVQALMSPGLDPHGHRHTRSDIAALARADVVLWHGLGLEAQMLDLMADLARSRPVVALAETLPTDRLIAHPDYPGRYDPHVWMDPDLWALAADPVATVLAALRPDLRLDAALTALRDDAAALAGYARATLATVPEAARVLVSAHDAFGYLGRAHGWQVEGIQGLSTESEAGLARIAQLVDLLVDRRIGAVFVESSVSERSVRALIEGAAARGHTVFLGGELYSDAMGPAGTYEGTWPGMIDHNVTTIARALGGAAPERGRLGRLGGAA